jgi:hypothetical protein
MGRSIFIFLFILAIFLTIVSNSNATVGVNHYESALNSHQFTAKDSIQSLFSADFETDNLPGWKQTDEWEVSAIEIISGNKSLKHSTKATSGNSQLFHSANADLNLEDLEWRFSLKNGNWDPSSSNRFWFYLSADTIQTDLINGWAAGVNISGSSDLLELWRIRKGKPDSLIVQTDLDWNAGTSAIINVKRTVRGVWTIQYQKSGEAKSRIFSGSDFLNSGCKNIGLQFIFTPTRAGQLWMDDISVFRLPAELYIQKLTLINSVTLVITFNKPVNLASIHSGKFILTDENKQPIQITQATQISGSANSIELHFAKNSGIELNLTVAGISDLAGKLMKPDSRAVSYSVSSDAGSVLINEILFNPYSGGVDFVELVNVSDQSIPVHRLKLATRDEVLSLKQIYPVSTEKRYLKPGQFLVCTKDPAIVLAQYPNCNPETFGTLKSFPSYSDDSGTVVLLNDSLDILDEISYTAKMHSPLLANEEGVSLERISLEKPTADRSNWASAAASVGFATPGLPNSQTESETEIQDEITPEPKAFSPNGDGYNDQLAIQFKFGKPGYIANVSIFDAVGRQVRFLVNNQSLAQEGSWLWDGKSESGQRLSIGVYIILVEVFDREGHTKAFKKTCTLTDRLE